MSETIKITLAGKEFDCPPLRYGGIRKGAFRSIRRLGEIHKTASPEALLDPMSDVFEDLCQHVVTVFQAALSVIYPEITASWMDDNLTLDDILRMVTAFPDLMRISGFVDSGEVTSGSKTVPEGILTQNGDGSPQE